MIFMLLYLVIRSFADQATEDLFNGRNTSAARMACPIGLWSIVRRRFRWLQNEADSVEVADYHD